MSESVEIQQAIVEQRPRISRVWLLPLIALLIGGWMVYYQFSHQGPLITIEFDNANGLEAGKTKLKTLDLVVGVVEEITLKPDLSGVIASARINLKDAQLLGDDAKFWVVAPNISLTGISGLGTVLSGPYINMAPAGSSSEQRHFVALKTPPVTPIGTPGQHIQLVSSDEAIYRVGDQVFYNGMSVGTFETARYDEQSGATHYDVFIRAPFHTLLHDNTRFWNISGLNVSLTADGITVESDSLSTLLMNGVTFGLPENSDTGSAVEERHEYTIYRSYADAIRPRFEQTIQFVLLVEDSVRGLKEGAPVEFRGIKVGQVEKVNYNSQLDKGIAQIPVLLSIQPGLAGMPDNVEGAEFINQRMPVWIESGLRAALKTGNLLTGATYVDLQRYPDAKPVEPARYQSITVIPLIPDGVARITESINDTLQKVNKLPLAEISSDVRKLLKGINQTVGSLDTTIKDTNGVINTIEGESITDALQRLNELLQSYSSGSRNYQNINDTMTELQQTLQETRLLIQKLNRTPNSLVFDGGKQPLREPQANPNTQAGAR